MTVSNDQQWKPIPTYPNYEVSNLGQVKNKLTGRLLSLSTKKGRHPYQRAHLCQDGKSRYLLVHRLVLEAFVGPCQEGQQCLHLDSNPRNNRLDNLKWDTVVENHKTIDRNGEKNGRSKLSADDVIFIKEYTGRLKDLVEMFNVSYGYITNIRSNITWKHL